MCYDSCGQNAGASAWNYAMQPEVACISDHIIANLIFWSYKPGLALEQVEITLERIAKVSYRFFFLGEIKNSTEQGPEQLDLTLKLALL